MINTAIALTFCLLSLLVGVVLGLAVAYFVVKNSAEYEEADDWPDDDWAKTYEEIRDGR